MATTFGHIKTFFISCKRVNGALRGPRAALRTNIYQDSRKAIRPDMAIGLVGVKNQREITPEVHHNSAVQGRVVSWAGNCRVMGLCLGRQEWPEPF